jgi:hypothetical protein
VEDGGGSLTPSNELSKFCVVAHRRAGRGRSTRSSSAC